MISSFVARIYKFGINACVDVPLHITEDMNISGYIPVKGAINSCPYTQTLCPVKKAPYRLFVNRAMLIGSSTKIGDTAMFTIELDDTPRKVPMPDLLKEKLMEKGLMDSFYNLSESRQKDIKNYINSLKTEASQLRNIKKVINQLEQAGI